MSSPYDQIPGMQMQNSGKSPARAVILFLVAFGFGFALGNLYVFSFDSGLFEDNSEKHTSQLNEKVLEIQTLKLKVEEKDKTITMLQDKLDSAENEYQKFVKKTQNNTIGITILEPKPEAKIDSEIVTFKGSTSKPGAILSINNFKKVTTDENGNFEFEFALKSGKNDVSILAYLQDDPNSSSELVWTVHKKAKWQTIQKFQGGPGKINTDNFKINGDKSRFLIRPLSKGGAGHYLSATLYRPPKKFEGLMYNKANSTIQGEEPYDFNESGEFYISVYSVKMDWEIVVEAME